MQKVLQQARIDPSSLVAEHSSGLIITSCETRYGFAAIACTPTGIRRLDLFCHKQQLDLFMQQHMQVNPVGSDQSTTEHAALAERVRRAVLEHVSLEDLPLELSGTTFQRKVWHYLRSIPAGEVRSYSEVAVGLGVSSAVRAVANACARNVVALAIPCHRVVRADRSLGGYRWGTRLKEQLLFLEGQARPETACFQVQCPIASSSYSEDTHE